MFSQPRLPEEFGKALPTNLSETLRLTAFYQQMSSAAPPHLKCLFDDVLFHLRYRKLCYSEERSEEAEKFRAIYEMRFPEYKIKFPSHKTREISVQYAQQHTIEWNVADEFEVVAVNPTHVVEKMYAQEVEEPGCWPEVATVVPGVSPLCSSAPCRPHVEHIDQRVDPPAEDVDDGLPAESPPECVEPRLPVIWTDDDDDNCIIVESPYFSGFRVFERPTRLHRFVCAYNEHIDMYVHAQSDIELRSALEILQCCHLISTLHKVEYRVYEDYAALYFPVEGRGIKTLSQLALSAYIRRFLRGKPG